MTQRIEPVTRVRAIDPAEFQAHFERADRPVVIEGAALEWPATRSWSPTTLAERFAGVEIQFKLSSSNVHPNFHETSLGAMFARGRADFADFMRAISDGPRADRARRLFTGDERFLLRRRNGQTDIDEQLGSLLQDVRIPEYFGEPLLYTAWAWFSGPGVRTWLHYDNNGCHNLNAQITGSKEFTLFAPSELPRLAPFPLGGDNPALNCSRIDVDAVDAASFPGFADACCQGGTLRAGDLLFIPAFWLHTFRHTGDFNSNVNFWWKPELVRDNPVARRQALIDLVAASGLDPRAEGASSVLAALDRAAISGAPSSQPK